MRTVLHFQEAADSSGFFPQLARLHDRSRFRMLLGSLQPMDLALRQAAEAAGVSCFSCDAPRRSSYPGALARLVAYLRRERVDILHTHLFDPSVVGLWAGVLAGTRARVMTRHYSDYHTRIHKRWHTALDRMCLRLAHKVVAVSRHTADHLAEVERVPRDKIEVVLNGVEFDRFKALRADPRAELRAELGLGDAFVLLVLARLHVEKGHSYLFRALPGLRASLPKPVVVLLAGEGSYEAAYRAEVASLACEDSVRFLGFRKDAADLIAACDLMVLPSVAEAFGIALVEALYLGAPIVATTAGGIPEIVDHEVDGLLVPPGDSAALEGAIRSLLLDPERRRRLAGAGREQALNRFSFERMVRGYEALYDRLAEGSPS